MQRSKVLLSLLVLSFFAVALTPAVAQAPDSQEQAVLRGLSSRFQDVAQTAIPRTVCIRIAVGEKTGFGTGALITPEGHILTCAHVSEPGTSLTVILSNGRETPARRLGKNSKNDYSMVKIEGGPYPFFELGASGDLGLGDWVVALGHPGGPYKDRKPAVAVGRVTGLNRKLPVQFNVKYYDNAIQTDAPIFAGNSGGPLVNLKGELVGINGAILLINENAYATPIDEIRPDIAAMKRGRHLPGRAPENLWKVMQELTSEIDPKDLEKMYEKSSIGRMLGPLLKMFSGRGGAQADKARAERRAAMARYGRTDGLLDAYTPLGEALVSSTVEIESGGATRGFGVVIDRDGSILTNDRLIDRPVSSVSVRFQGRRYRARVLGRHGPLDVALLSVPGIASRATPPEFGDSAALRPGAWVVSMGTASRPLAVGVVSANDRAIGRHRKIPTMGIMGMLGKPNASPLREYPAVIQHDQPLESGQFGSPLFDDQGRLVGVNVANFYRGSSYAAPLSEIAPLLSRLRDGLDVAPPPFLEPVVEKDGGLGGSDGGDFGDFMKQMQEMMKRFMQPDRGPKPAPRERPHLGITGQDTGGNGIEVTAVVEGSAAEKAGLEVGDVIIVFANKRVASLDDLVSVLSGMQPGDKAVILYMRDGKQIRTLARLGKR